jgi:hypothetical protein
MDFNSIDEEFSIPFKYEDLQVAEDSLQQFHVETVYEYDTAADVDVALKSVDRMMPFIFTLLSI